jgi:hypothetical protein
MSHLSNSWISQCHRHTQEDLFNQDKGEVDDKMVEAGKGDVAAEEDACHLQTMCKHLDVGEEARDSKDVEALMEHS